MSGENDKVLHLSVSGLVFKDKRHLSTLVLVVILSFEITEASRTEVPGIPVATGDCLMSWEDFRDKVCNRRWISPYIIDDNNGLGPDFDNPGKGVYLFTVEPTGKLKRVAGEWARDDGVCLDVNGTFMLSFADDDRNRPRNKQPTGTTNKKIKQKQHMKATFNANPNGSFFVPGRVDNFLSTDPDKFLIWQICHSQEKGICTNSLTFIMVQDQRTDTERHGVSGREIVLDNIPWGRMDGLLRSCLGRGFADNKQPPVKWIWNGPECPLPEN